MKQQQSILTFTTILVIFFRPTEGDGRNTYVSSEQISLLFDYDDKMTQQVRTAINKKYSHIFSYAVEENNQHLDFTIPLLNGSQQSSSVNFHPINQFLILYKFNKIWPRMSRAISMLFGEELKVSQNSRYPLFNLVSHLQRAIDHCTIPDEDLSKAATSLLRLQELYNLKTSQLASNGAVHNSW
ncbi:uncharacterized protein LOC142356148 [Convolutriloba macropyga]|uniref:uncharacterized protein LOC142356148 n=1 Tax=Convolutriloba macropyga TaxID=536237 RepID=UPI003F525F98